MCPVPSIMLADNHPVILMGLAAAIGQLLQQQVVAQAHGGRELMQVFAHIDCNIIVTDYNLGGEPVFDGMQLLACLRQQYPRCGIVVCAMVHNPALLRTMRQIGVACIVSKNGGFVHTEYAIMAAVRGVHYDSPHVLEELGLDSNDWNGLERPGAREREMLRLYVVGTAVSDIAQMLGLSVKTVSTQKAMALHKLGPACKIDLPQYARASGLIAPR